MAVLSLPLIISGVAFGVMLNLLCPSVIIIASFVLFTLYMSYGMGKKALFLREQENEKLLHDGGESSPE